MLRLRKAACLALPVSLLLFHTPGECSASDSTSAIGSDVAHALSSLGHVLTSPGRWNSTDLVRLAGFGAVTGAGFALDDEVRSSVLSHRSPLKDGIETIGYDFGAPEYMGTLCVLVYGGSLLFDSYVVRRTSLFCLETIVAVGIIQIPARLIAGRARPEVGEGNGSWEFFGGTSQERSSFFSGHSAIAFGISTVLARTFRSLPATIGLYALASLTPFARMYADRHWFSDVIIGTGLGIAIGNTIVSWNVSTPAESSSFDFTPTLNGVMVSFRW